MSTVITSANTHHDVTVATNTVDNIVIERSQPLPKDKKNNIKKKKQNLCLDKAYHSQEVEQEIFRREYIPHIRHRREEKEEKKLYKKHPARRCG